MQMGLGVIFFSTIKNWFHTSEWSLPQALFRWMGQLLKSAMGWVHPDRGCHRGEWGLSCTSICLQFRGKIVACSSIRLHRYVWRYICTHGGAQRPCGSVLRSHMASGHCCFGSVHESRGPRFSSRVMDNGSGIHGSKNNAYYFHQKYQSRTIKSQ